MSDYFKFIPFWVHFCSVMNILYAYTTEEGLFCCSHYTLSRFLSDAQIWTRWHWKRAVIKEEYEQLSRRLCSRRQILWCPKSNCLDICFNIICAREWFAADFMLYFPCPFCIFRVHFPPFSCERASILWCLSPGKLCNRIQSHICLFWIIIRKIRTQRRLRSNNRTILKCICRL